MFIYNDGTVVVIVIKMISTFVIYMDEEKD